MEPEMRLLLVRIILRATAALFGIIVLGVVEQNALYYLEGNVTACVFGQTAEKITGNEKACSYSLAVGVLALIAAFVLTAVDIGASVVRQKKETRMKLVVIADLITSVIMAFLALFAFAFLTELWTKTENLKTEYPSPPSSSRSSARATIGFFFLSTVVWVVLVVLDAVRVKGLPGQFGEAKYDSL